MFAISIDSFVEEIIECHGSNIFVPSGFLYVPPALTSTHSAFCLPQLMCFVWISEQTGIFFLIFSRIVSTRPAFISHVCVTVHHWYSNINSQLDATITNFINNCNQLNMFRLIISPILRSTRLCLQLVVQSTEEAACWCLATSRQHRRCFIPQAVNTVYCCWGLAKL